MPLTVRTEVCVQTSVGARTAARGGADRIQLCAAIELGGLTPSAGLIEAVVDLVPTHVLIRPRAGDHVYDRYDIRVMIKDIEYAIDRGAESVVVGALTANGDIDLSAMVRLLGSAGDVAVTFSMAFDSVRDPLAALDDLLELGVDRLLTSGGRPTAAEGADNIAEYIRRCGDDLCVVPGGHVGPDNAAAIVRSTGAREIQLTAGTAESLRAAVDALSALPDLPAGP